MKAGETVRNLCLTCGLCCDGTLFATVELRLADDAANLRGLGIPVSGQNPPQFLQPCPALDAGCRCRVYAVRPEQCRRFVCALLRSFQTGEIGEEAALRTISETRRKASTVRRLLRELGDTDERTPLAKRFHRLKDRLEGEENALSPNREEQLDCLAGLTMAVHELQFVLRREFYAPGAA